MGAPKKLKWTFVFSDFAGYEVKSQGRPKGERGKRCQLQGSGSHGRNFDGRSGLVTSYVAPTLRRHGREDSLGDKKNAWRFIWCEVSVRPEV